MPEAPIAANGILYYDAYVGVGAPVSPIGLWAVGDFQTEYGLSDYSTLILGPALTRADSRVQGWITAACYADALLLTPTSATRQVTIKYAIADLTLLYLRQQGTISPEATKTTKSYAGIKSYSAEYASGITGQTYHSQEATILARMHECKRTTTFEPKTAWDSGRWMPIITLEEEDTD
jgi:hypothetical protein